jgi:PAS domain S-box-containing protein
VSAVDLAVFEETVEQLYDDAPVGYVSFTADRVVVRANRTVLRWLGLDAGDVVGRRTFSQLVSGGGRIYLETHLFPLLALEGEVREIALELVRRDGSRLPVLVNVSTDPGTSGRPLVHRAIIFDARERRSYERELLAARREAEGTAARLALLQDIIAALSAATRAEDVAAVVAEATAKAFGVDASIVWLRVSDELRAVPSPSWPAGVVPPALAESDDGPHWRALRTGTTVSLDFAGAQAAHPAVAARMAAVGHRHVCFVPFQQSSDSSGVVSFGFLRSDPPDPADLPLLQAVADHAGAALARAALYDQQRDIALTLQRSLIVHHLPVDDRLGFEARYSPAVAGVEVGGDWYDAFRIDDRIGLVVGDVVGRGLTAATVMGQLRNAARALSQSGFGPSRTLEHLDTFAAQLPDAAHTTLVCAELDVDSGWLRYACAGHLPPLLLRDGATRFLFEGRSPPLSVMGVGSRPEGEVQLQRGDALLMFTDGLVERRGETLDDGFERLAAAVRRLPPDGDIDELINAMVPDGVDDDVCVLRLVYRGGGCAA